MASEADVRVQNECAVRCTIVSRPVVALEYVKAISSLVGASHVLAIFEDSDYIKVYFDDKRCVDTVMKNCVHVLGRHVKVDYVIPPGVKLTLSNVDPVITNFDISRLLALYGNVVSPIIRPPISDDIELCHISYGVRYVYMIIANDFLPDKIEFRYGDRLTFFRISLVENVDTLTLTRIKTDTAEESQDEESHSTGQSPDSLPGPSDTDTLTLQESTDPVLVSVRSLPATIAIEHFGTNNQHTPVASEAMSTTENTEPRLYVRKKAGRPPLASRKRLVAVSQAARRIKIAKHKLMRGYKKKRKYRRRKIMRTDRNTRSTNLLVSPNTLSDMPDLVKMSEIVETDEDVLSSEDLMKYIEEVKGHRAPLELARKYIGADCDSKKVFSLIEQLQKFKKNQDDMNLKARIWRLLKTIKDALASENKNN